MRKLLSANLSRLRKDKFFWCLLLTVIVMSLVNMLTSAQSFQATTENGFEVFLEDYYFNQAPLMGAFFALFASLFLGTEYSDGTIRNKLAVGHTRTSVYLAGFLTCLTASMALLIAWLSTSALGFFLIGPMGIGLSGYVSYVLVAVGFTFSLTALFSLVGSLSTNKAMTVIETLTIFIIMLLLASAINDRLCIPQMTGGTAYLNGEFVTIPLAPNPQYLGGAARTVWECILDFLPTGQALLMNETDITHPVREMLFSGLLTVLLLLSGCSAFYRKDLK